MTVNEPEFGLQASTLAQIRDVFKQHPAVREVLIYGSRAKGTFRPGSDIDLTLIGDNLDLKLLNKIANELDDLLLPYTFDLSLYHHIEHQDLQDQIKRAGKKFFP